MELYPTETFRSDIPIRKPHSPWNSKFSTFRGTGSHFRDAKLFRAPSWLLVFARSVCRCARLRLLSRVYHWLRRVAFRGHWKSGVGDMFVHVEFTQFEKYIDIYRKGTHTHTHMNFVACENSWPSVSFMPFVTRWSGFCEDVDVWGMIRGLLSFVWCCLSYGTPWWFNSLKNNRYW